MGVEACSTTAIWVQALQPVMLALVTGILALLVKRQTQTRRVVNDVREHQSHAEELAAFLRRRPNGVEEG